jgi:hypothetical protein
MGAWHPDVVVNDITECAAPIAAERAGLPSVAIDVSLTDMLRFADAVADGCPTGGRATTARSCC